MHNNILQYPDAPLWRDTARLEPQPFHPRGNDSPTSSAESMSVFIVDIDDAHRARLEALIACGGAWRTEGFANAQEILERAPHPGPCCLLLDADLEQAGGLALQRRVAAERTEMPIIFMAGNADVPLAVQAMKSGAMDFLTKPVCGRRLLRAIEDALELSRAARDRASSVRTIQMRHAALSRREQEVMSLVVSGMLNKQVGAELGISEVTVKAHRGSVMRKMGARSLPDLVNMASKLREPLLA
jgi:FixJ family two-component response regulator